MTTKTIEETIVNKKTVYISADGKEWENKDDCIQWENGIECVANTAWAKVPKIEVDTTQCGLPWSNEDEEAYIVVPRNHDDIIAIENYVRTTAHDSTGLDDSDINKAYILNFGYDYDWCGVTNIDTHIARIVEYLTKKTAEVK